MKSAIIGGVAGGASAATRARRLNEEAEITIYEKGPYVSYANCGLPYYIGGIIRHPHDLLLETPESLWDCFRIKVHVRSEVNGIDLRSGFLEVVHDDAKYQATFDRLILAPGATTMVPKIPGMDRSDVFSLRTVPDAVRMHQYLDSGLGRHATVVGAGFIGLEMAEVLRARGVTVVERQSHILPPFDADMAQYLEKHMVDMEIQLRLESTLAGISGVVGYPIVQLASGDSFHTDMVVLGLGVRPALTLARMMGLAIGPTGAIRVTDHMQTSAPGVWAAGDAVEERVLVTGQSRWWPLAGTANKEGRLRAPIPLAVMPACPEVSAPASFGSIPM